MPEIITIAQSDFFNKNGYLLVKSIFPENELIKYRNKFAEIFRSGVWTKVKFSSPNNLNDIYFYFPELAYFIFNENYISVLKGLLGDNLICMPECSIHYNRFYDWHRDTTRMEQQGISIHKQPSMVMIQACTYFQDNTPDGGGVTVNAGSQFKADRFVNMYSNKFRYRVKYKIAKISGLSPFEIIEKKESPVNIYSESGDLVLFNNQLDHRATFSRKNKATAAGSKFAIFNTFTNNEELAFQYQESLKKPDEPYARFLRNHPIPEVLISISEKLNFKLCY